MSISIFLKKIKIEDWKTAIEYFRKGELFIKFVLINGYHHIDIFCVHPRFSCFSLPSPSAKENLNLYIFAVFIHVGFSPAP